MQDIDHIIRKLNQKFLKLVELQQVAAQRLEEAQTAVEELKAARAAAWKNILQVFLSLLDSDEKALIIERPVEFLNSLLKKRKGKLTSKDKNVLFALVVYNPSFAVTCFAIPELRKIFTEEYRTGQLNKTLLVAFKTVYGFRVFTKDSFQKFHQHAALDFNQLLTVATQQPSFARVLCVDTNFRNRIIKENSKGKLTADVIDQFKIAYALPEFTEQKLKGFYRHLRSNVTNFNIPSSLQRVKIIHTLMGFEPLKELMNDKEQPIGSFTEIVNLHADAPHEIWPFIKEIVNGSSLLESAVVRDKMLDAFLFAENNSLFDQDSDRVKSIKILAQAIYQPSNTVGKLSVGVDFARALLDKHGIRDYLSAEHVEAMGKLHSVVSKRIFASKELLRRLSAKQAANLAYIHGDKVAAKRVIANKWIGKDFRAELTSYDLACLVSKFPEIRKRILRERDLCFKLLQANPIALIQLQYSYPELLCAAFKVAIKKRWLQKDYTDQLGTKDFFTFSQQKLNLNAQTPEKLVELALSNENIKNLILENSNIIGKLLTVNISSIMDLEAKYPRFSTQFFSKLLPLTQDSENVSGLTPKHILYFCAVDEANFDSLNHEKSNKYPWIKKFFGKHRLESYRDVILENVWFKNYFAGNISLEDTQLFGGFVLGIVKNLLNDEGGQLLDLAKKNPQLLKQIFEKFPELKHQDIHFEGKAFEGLTLKAAMFANHDYHQWILKSIRLVHDAGRTMRVENHPDAEQRKQWLAAVKQLVDEMWKTLNTEANLDVDNLERIHQQLETQLKQMPKLSRGKDLTERSQDVSLSKQAERAPYVHRTKKEVHINGEYIKLVGEFTFMAPPEEKQEEILRPRKVHFADEMENTTDTNQRPFSR